LAPARLAANRSLTKPLNSTNKMALPSIDSLASKPALLGRRSIGDLLAPLERIAAESSNLVADHGAQQTPPNYLKEAAFVAALRMILARYREFIAYAPNL
jgi:hypothetical protein